MSDPNTSVSSFPVVLPADPTAAEQAATKHYVDQVGAAKVSKAGDTLTGPLILAGDPTAPNEAATKAYADSLGRPTASQVTSTATGDVSATNVQAAIAELSTEKIAKHGDNMTGPLLLENDSPSQPLEATAKSYVDRMGSYEYSFLSTDFSWNATAKMYEIVINHSLNRRPRVTIYDQNGIEIQGRVIYNVIGVNGLVIRLKIALDIHVLLT